MSDHDEILQRYIRETQAEVEPTMRAFLQAMTRLLREQGTDHVTAAQLIRSAGADDDAAGSILTIVINSELGSEHAVSQLSANVRGVLLSVLAVGLATGAELQRQEQGEEEQWERRQ